jgi:sarcosine oxidase
MADFDAIVLGVGGMGSAALYHLARRGLRVLGIEQFSLAHDRGSSHGQTRIIRKAYFEHPAYVPLLHRTYELWGDLERHTGQKLFYRTGLLLGGPPDGMIVTGIQRSAREHHLDIQSLTPSDVSRRYPGLRVPPEHTALFEPDAGFLRVEACVRAHADAAATAGAQILTAAPVQSWSAAADRVTVRNADAEHTARALVIAGGAWASRLLSDLHLPLEVRRKVVFWYETSHPCYEMQAGCPVYGFETSQGFLYGFPAIDDAGVKVAHHSGGQTVRDPSALDRNLYPEDEAPVLTFVASYLPSLRPRRLQHSVCMYTMTPDEHFVIDRHPAYRSVVYAAGLSGHGFKFAPIIGAVLADLAIDGRTDQPIDFLSARRFQ